MRCAVRKSRWLLPFVFFCLFSLTATGSGFLTREAGAFSVTLGWDPNRESDLAGYRIHYDTGSGPPYRYTIDVPLSTPNFNRYTPQYTVAGLAEGVEYYFALTAYNGLGLESGYSNEVHAGSSPSSSLPSQNRAPVLSSLQVNGRSGRTAVYTNSRNVNIRIVASDDVLVSEYLILDGKSDPSGETFSPLPGGPRQNPIFTISDFSLNDADGIRTIYAWVKDDRGLVSAAASKSNVLLRRVASSFAGFPAINYNDSSLTIAYRENNMRNASSASNYTFNNGLLFAGDGVDISGTNRVFRFPLNPGTLQPYTIYDLQIKSTVTDAAGNAVTPNTVRVNDDDWEILNGLNPLDALERDWDFYQDWWRNYEEYPHETVADDPTSMLHPASAIDVIEVIPIQNAGLGAQEKGIQDTSGVSVRIESLNGVNTSDPDGVTFTVKDGNRTYTRKLNDLNDGGQKIVRAVPLDGDGDLAYSFWAVYYRSNETQIPNFYPFGSIVEVTVEARDKAGDVMEPLTIRFRVQSEEEMNAEAAKLPFTSVSVNSTMGTKTITVESGPFEGASMMFPTTLLQEIGVEPYFGPVGDIPPLTAVDGAGVPVNLLPDIVFPSPVTLLIPCPGYDDLSNLEIYYYDGQDWWLACDRNGNVTAEGEGWMVPGSRVNHYNGNSSAIEIMVYHFSAVIAGSAPPPSFVVTGGSGGGVGCFIETLK